MRLKAWNHNAGVIVSEKVTNDVNVSVMSRGSTACVLEVSKLHLSMHLVETVLLLDILDPSSCVRTCNSGPCSQLL